MQKNARKKSLDPVQEHLREHKAQWNKGVSEFIDNLINFKKLINGSISKFNTDKSTITNPLPKDPVHIISSLANSFNDLATDGNEIIIEQIAYSESKKKKQNLATQLANSEECFELLSEGSNAFTRFISKLKRPWFGDGDASRNKRFRLSILDATTKLEKQYFVLQSDIVGSGPESIFKSSQMFFKIIDEIELILSQLISIKSIPEAMKDDPKITSIFDKYQMLINDFKTHKMSFANSDPQISNRMLKLIEQFDEAKEKRIVSDDLFQKIEKTHKEFLNDLCKKLNIQAKSITELHKLYNEKIKQQPKEETNPIINVQAMQVTADKFVGRMLGKLKHKIWSDKTTASKIEIYNIADECLKRLDEMLNSLENSLDVEYLINNFKFIQLLNDNISSILLPLVKSISGQLMTDTYMDTLQDRYLRDHDIILSDKQKQDVKRKIEREQLKRIIEEYNKIQFSNNKKQLKVK
jgi:hypothetical protein